MVADRPRVTTASVSSPLGPLLMAYAAGALVALEFDDQAARLRAHLQRRYARCGVVAGDPDADVSGCLQAYFDGDIGALAAVQVHLAGTAFQQRVWTALRSIPPGETSSYAALARRIGAPQASRATGRANALNPVSLVVPCHRVIGSDGSLTGYAGGIERKRWLLRHEGAFA